MKKEFSHLIKTLPVFKEPFGLYPGDHVFMAGKDLEGFNASFSFGFIKKAGAVYPEKGMLVNPFDRCLVFAGTDTRSILRLGAKISIVLGEECEEYNITEPSVVLIPKGMPYGPVTVKKVDNPIVYYSIGLASEYKVENIAEKQSKPVEGTKYRKLIKKLMTTIDPAQKGSGMGYERVTDSKGVMHPAERGIGPGNGDQIVWLFGNDLEGFSVNFTWGFYSRCGKWHRGGEAHTHPEEEILVFVGLDPDHLGDLNAELELGMGKDYERHIFNKPTVAICPKGFPHLPLITRWVDKPYGFFVICLSGEHASPWVEA